MTVLAPYPCPECGGNLHVDTGAQTESPTYKKDSQRVEIVLRPATVAFCASCDFAIEIKPVSWRAAGL